MQAKALVGAMLSGAVAPVGVACSLFAEPGGVVAVTLGGLFVTGLVLIAGSYFEGVTAELSEDCNSTHQLPSHK